MSVNDLLELNDKLARLATGYNESLAVIAILRAELAELLQRAVVLDKAIAARFATCEQLAATFITTREQVTRIAAALVKREQEAADPADWWKGGDE